MKRMIFPAALLLLAAGHATAQRTSTKAFRATTLNNNSDTAATAGSAPATGSARNQDNTKIYNWNDGQAATTTGHEATSINGGYAAMPKNQNTKPSGNK